MYKTRFLFLWIFIIAFLIYIQSTVNKEGFTPKIRGLYRPHVRNMRIYSEGFLNHYTGDFFKKHMKRMGIY
jgi:hypothetical protein